MEKLNREQAIAIVGLEAVEAVEKENCDFTNRLMDYDVEFSAGVLSENKDGEKVSLVAYYYQSKEDVEECQELDHLDWEISHYEIH